MADDDDEALWNQQQELREDIFRSLSKVIEHAQIAQDFLKMPDDTGSDYTMRRLSVWARKAIDTHNKLNNSYSPALREAFKQLRPVSGTLADTIIQRPPE